MLALITPTRGRPRAMQLCEIMVKRMIDYYCGEDEVQWIVAEGVEHTGRQSIEHVTSSCSHWRVRTPQPDELSGPQSQGQNIENALQLARQIAGASLRVLIIEDDDWYDPHRPRHCRRVPLDLLQRQEPDLDGVREREPRQSRLHRMG